MLKDQWACETYTKAMTNIPSPITPPPSKKEKKCICPQCGNKTCLLYTWITSNSCNLLLPAEISAGKGDFIPNTHLSVPYPACLCTHTVRGRKKKMHRYLLLCVCVRLNCILKLYTLYTQCKK